MMSEYVGLPYAPGSETSKAAAMMKTNAVTERRRVLLYIESQEGKGATRDEIGYMLNLNSGSVCPRVDELKKSKDIYVGRQTRYTRHGRMAEVLLGADFKEEGSDE